MGELFVELFSEEIPVRLQTDARLRIKQLLEERLKKKEIKFRSSQSFSTPKRLVFVMDGISETIEEKISLFYESNKNIERENALKFAKKRNLLSDNQNYEKKLAKMARAGFSYEIAKDTLKSLIC